MPKLRNPQPKVDSETIKLRLHAAKSSIDLMHALAKVALPQHKADLRPNLELLMVMMAVFIGDAEGHPMSAAKAARFTSIPRSTVYRHLERLQKINKIVRVGKGYHYAPDAMFPDRQNAILKAINRVCEKVVRNGRMTLS